MKERPILFSGAMVRAILDNQKTQTRRIIKPQPNVPAGGSGWDAIRFFTGQGKWCWSQPYSTGNGASGFVRAMETRDYPYLTCPYGQPGDRLWVREAFSDTGSPIYKATFNEEMLKPGCKLHWKPSIHMPRWASRITLEITGVRVERVQEISEEDARAEGCKSADFATGRECVLNPEMGSYKLHFRGLWDSIYAAKGFGWDANPWVWVIEFRRIK